MKNLKKQFKIIVLEDNEFYNNILTRQLKNYTNEISYDKGYDFVIDSYINAHDCLRNLRPDTDIAIIDFYLGESINAIQILKAIKEKCKDCKVIIISQYKTIKNYYKILSEGAYHFIIKDHEALAKSCFVIEDIVNEHLRPTA